MIWVSSVSFHVDWLGGTSCHMINYDHIDDYYIECLWINWELNDDDIPIEIVFFPFSICHIGFSMTLLKTPWVDGFKLHFEKIKENGKWMG